MIVYGAEVAQWVYERVGGAVSAHSQGIGWAVGGKLRAACAYESFNGHNIFMHTRVDGFASRLYWWAIFDYPFRQLGCTRVSVAVSAVDERILRLLRNIGFRLEATLLGADRGGEDMQVWVLWKENCRMLRWKGM